MREFDMKGFAEHLEAVAVKAAAMPDEAATIAAPMLSANIKGVMGDLTFLETLSEFTIADRVAQGWTPNDPLVRRGDLRASVKHESVGHVAAAGTSDYRSRWLEYGTPGAQYPIPPRPAHLIGQMITVDEMHPIVENLVKEVLD